MRVKFFPFIPAGSVVVAVLAILLVRPVTGAAVDPKPDWTTGLDLVTEGAVGGRGGAARGQSWHGLALAKIAWNPAERPEGVHLQTYVSVLSLMGRGPSERFLGDFLAASNIEGFASTRLYSWWAEAKAGDWNLRAGALLADDEFCGTEAGGNLFHSAFGWPAFISANTVNTGPAFYVAAPGVRLERGLGAGATWRFGVYDGDSFDSPAGDPQSTRHGLHYRVGGAQGWLVLSEFSFAPVGGASRAKVGFWWHTAEFADVRDDVGGRRIADTGNAARMHAGNFGGYVVAERTVAGKSGEAGCVSAFVRAGLAPVDRNALSWVVDSGVAVTGLLPGRPSDVASLGLVFDRFSPRFSSHARALDPASPAPDFEHVVELNYSAALTERVSLQPDFQFIRHPGGSALRRDACLFLLRVKASF